MVNRCSKSLHFGRKSWGEFEKPTPEVPILGTVCHLDLICGVFRQILTNSDNYHQIHPAILNLGFHDIGIIAPRGVYNSS